MRHHSPDEHPSVGGSGAQIGSGEDTHRCQMLAFELRGMTIRRDTGCPKVGPGHFAIRQTRKCWRVDTGNDAGETIGARIGNRTRGPQRSTTIKGDTTAIGAVREHTSGGHCFEHGASDVNALCEFSHGGIRTVGVALGHDEFGKILADRPHRGQPKAH